MRPINSEKEKAFVDKIRRYIQAALATAARSKGGYILKSEKDRICKDTAKAFRVGEVYARFNAWPQAAAAFKRRRNRLKNTSETVHKLAYIFGIPPENISSLVERKIIKNTPAGYRQFLDLYEFFTHYTQKNYITLTTYDNSHEEIFYLKPRPGHTRPFFLPPGILKEAEKDWKNWLNFLEIERQDSSP